MFFVESELSNGVTVDDFVIGQGLSFNLKYFLPPDSKSLANAYSFFSTGCSGLSGPFK